MTMKNLFKPIKRRSSENKKRLKRETNLKKEKRPTQSENQKKGKAKQLKNPNNQAKNNLISLVRVQVSSNLPEKAVLPKMI